MLLSDLLNVFQWWITIFFIGIIFIPITNLIFPNFFDKGYIFAKIIGIALISYTVFILGFLKILPFEIQNIFLIIGIFILINLFILKKIPLSNIKLKSMLPIFILEECIFILILMFWSFIHTHQPEIHGLEKYMDFGFINSILRAEYFPPKDMWLTPFYINYYYFGHLATAVLTKLSILPSSITYNLMLSTISGFTFVGAFSIGANLIHECIILSKQSASKDPMGFFANAQNASQKLKVLVGGLITAFILNFAGNLHSIYLFFKPYQNENPVPFWQLIFSPLILPNSYWYPNATRFIENTIHEFPLYSFVVSDLHGHVLDIPFVLLTIALLLSIFLKQKQAVSELKTQNSKLKTATQNLKVFSFKLIPLRFELCALSFILAIMYMTNAWDGIIYFILAVFIIFYLIIFKNSKFSFSGLAIPIVILGLGFIIFTLPFNLNFKPFASGIGVLCAPKFLTDIGNFGPFLFEADHCQHSPLWQLFILYGFFYFWIFSFFVFLFRKTKLILTKSDIFVLILIVLSTLLIIIPEFIYVKDIYPAHYRANTMFKLAYQAFIMFSLSCGYIIIRILNIKYKMSRIFNLKYVFLIFAILFFILVFLYPYHAIKSYFGDLKTYQGLNGIAYLNNLYPNDYEGILWINNNIKNQPVILEAQGDSYTDYGRVSANTGLPTVLGWTVHEWLWRGSYDIPSPRISEVTTMYESQDLEETKNLLEKYKVSLVFIGELEKQKYPDLEEEKFQSLGKIIFQKGDTKIYQILN